MDDERLERIMKRVFDIARQEGLTKPDATNPGKEIIYADRNWIIEETKKAGRLEP